MSDIHISWKQQAEVLACAPSQKNFKSRAEILYLSKSSELKTKHMFGKTSGQEIYVQNKNVI